MTLALVSFGAWCFCTGKERVLPVLVFVGAWNRVQILFLPAWWLAHRYGSGQRLDRRTWCWAGLSGAAFILPYAALRL